MKTRSESEQEKYYARKNARREWWKKHWGDFIHYPILVIIGSVVITFLWFVLCYAIYKTGRALDKHDNPDEYNYAAQNITIYTNVINETKIVLTNESLAYNYSTNGQVIYFYRK